MTELQHRLLQSASRASSASSQSSLSQSSSSQAMGQAFSWSTTEFAKYQIDLYFKYIQTFDVVRKLHEFGGADAGFIADVIAKQSAALTTFYLERHAKKYSQSFLPPKKSEEEDEKSEEVLKLEYQISCWREYTEYLTDMIHDAVQTNRRKYLTDKIHDAVQTNRRVPTAEERREKRPRGALFAAQSEAQSPIPDKRQRVVDVADALPPLSVSLRQHVVDLASGPTACMGAAGGK